MSQASDRSSAKARALASLKLISPEEDAAITAAAESDPDAQPLSETFMAGMKSDPELADQVARARGKRGPQKRPTKQPLTIRLDADVLEAYRSRGKGWQKLMADDLRRSAPFAAKHAEASEPINPPLRRSSQSGK